MSKIVKATIKMDTNGNKVVQVKAGDFRAFSIQANGNLPELHKLPPGTVVVYDGQDRRSWAVWKQIADHVRQYGTAKQKQALNISQ